MTKIGTPEKIGEANKKLILDRLRIGGDMSRADLTRETRMSFPAVSSNIRHLLEKGYIKEIGAGDNSVGRKSRLLSFNERRGFVAAIIIGRHETGCMLADLLGNAVASRVLPNRPDESGRDIVQSVIDGAGELLRESGVSAGSVPAVSVGVPGIVHNNERRFVTPHVIDFSLADLLAGLEGLFRHAAIFVENDINLGAIGEMWRGVGARYTDMVYIGYGFGFGSALILNRRLYKGADGAAGEIGFMAVDPEHLFSGRFSNVGSLESVIAEKKASLYFGMALVNICTLVNPQAIIISRDIDRLPGGRPGAEWEEMLRNHLPFPPEVVFSKLNGREPLLGAVHTALEHAYRAPIL